MNLITLSLCHHVIIISLKHHFKFSELKYKHNGRINKSVFPWSVDSLCITKVAVDCLYWLDRSARLGAYKSRYKPPSACLALSKTGWVKDLRTQRLAEPSQLARPIRGKAGFSKQKPDPFINSNFNQSIFSFSIGHKFYYKNIKLEELNRKKSKLV